MGEMLHALHSVTVDRAYCLQEKEIVFSSDRLSTDFIDIGTIDITNRSISEAAFQLDPLHSPANYSSLSSQPSGLQCCKSKVIVYSTTGMFSCHDMQSKQNIPYLGVSVTGGKSRQAPSGPIDIRHSCSSRAEDDICFFATSGDNSISVMHFTRQKNGQNSNDVSARLTLPIKLDQTKIGLGLGKGRITSMGCHPILPILFIMGTDGVYVLNYSNLLERLNNEFSSFSSSSDGNNDRNDDSSTKDGNDNDDMISENGGVGGMSPGTLVEQRRRLSSSLFKQKSSYKTSLLDFVCVAALVSPSTPTQEPWGTAAAFKMSVHAGGAFLGIMWKWGNSSALTTVCVYDIRSSSLHSTSITPTIILPIAQNNMNGIGSATKISNQPAVFSICFHPTEPLLFIGLISRQSLGSMKDQIITVCSLTLLEPSLRIVGMQNLDPPVAGGGGGYEDCGTKRDCHAAEIICDRSGTYVLIVYKHSESRTVVGETTSTKNVLRHVTISTYSLLEEWRRSNGCHCSIPVMTQLALPTSAFLPANLPVSGPTDGVLSKTRFANTAMTGSTGRLASSRTGRTVVAVRPLGEISLSGQKVYHSYVSILSFIFLYFRYFDIFSFYLLSLSFFLFVPLLLHSWHSTHTHTYIHTYIHTHAEAHAHLSEFKSCSSLR